MQEAERVYPANSSKFPFRPAWGQAMASVHIGAVMKDVLAKCYGGDISRKKKLLQKQAKGKSE